MCAHLIGTGPPVVLLHGQPGGAREFERVVPLLHGCALLVPDRPGYDGTPAGGFFAGADRVMHQLDELRAQRAVLAGFSWGGGVALAAALAYPGRVAALALLASVGVRRALTSADYLLARRPIGTAFAMTMRALGPRLARPMARANGSVVDADALDHLRAGLELVHDDRTWFWFLVEQRALLDETPELERRLGDITAPAVVLVGRADTTVPPAAGRELAVRLPDAQLREINAGHLLPLEAPQAVADAVREAVRLAELPPLPAVPPVPRPPQP